MLLLLATAMWGMSFPIIKAIRSDFYCENSSEISKSASYVFLRFGIVFLIYFLWVFVWKKEGKLSRQEFLVGSVIGVMGGVGMLLQGDSLAYTDPGTCAFITQMGCIWVPLVAFLRGRRAITPFFTFALLCGFLGLFLLSGFDPSRSTPARRRSALSHTAQAGRRRRKASQAGCAALPGSYRETIEALSSLA